MKVERSFWVVVFVCYLAACGPVASSSSFVRLRCRNPRSVRPVRNQSPENVFELHPPARPDAQVSVLGPGDHAPPGALPARVWPAPLPWSLVSLPGSYVASVQTFPSFIFKRGPPALIRFHG